MPRTAPWYGWSFPARALGWPPGAMGTSISPATLVVGALTLNATVGGVQRLRAEKALSARGGAAAQGSAGAAARRGPGPGRTTEAGAGHRTGNRRRGPGGCPANGYCSARRPAASRPCGGPDSTSRARRHHEPASRSSTRQCQPARRGPRAAQGADRLGPSWPGDRTRPSCQPGPYMRPPAADSRPDHRRTGRRLARCSPFGLRHRAPSDQLSPRAIQPCGPHPASESRGSGPPWTCWPSRSCCSAHPGAGRPWRPRRRPGAARPVRTASRTSPAALGPVGSRCASVTARPAWVERRGRCCPRPRSGAR